MNTFPHALHTNTLQYYTFAQYFILYFGTFATSDWNSHTRLCEAWRETRHWRLCVKSYNHVAMLLSKLQEFRRKPTHTYIEAKTNFRPLYLMVRKIGSSPDIIKIGGITYALLKSMNNILYLGWIINNLSFIKYVCGCYVRLLFLSLWYYITAI